jgi:hypothetical protein
MFAVALELSDFCRLYAVLAAVFAIRALLGDKTFASWVCAFVVVGHVTILSLWAARWAAASFSFQVLQNRLQFGRQLGSADKNLDHRVLSLSVVHDDGGQVGGMIDPETAVVFR